MSHQNLKYRKFVIYLRAVGLRLTPQRVALAHLLFAHGFRHLTAESLYAEAQRARITVSLATVYNTLRRYTDAGLLRYVPVDAARSYFDTNVAPHPHFYDQKSGMLIDIPPESFTILNMPTPPKNTEIDDITIVLRIKPAV